MEQLVCQWQSGDNTKPSELIFQVEGRTQSSLRVAAYAYDGGSCCGAPSTPEAGPAGDATAWP